MSGAQNAIKTNKLTNQTRDEVGKGKKVLRGNKNIDDQVAG